MMGGYGLGDEHVQITKIPERKKPVLLIGEGNEFRVIGTFRDDECAEEFYGLLGKWLRRIGNVKETR